MIRRALLSVSDKEGIVEFAKRLSAKGIEIVATGGTASALRDKGLGVRDIEDVTGFPECFGGRVKTLHPEIVGGILINREKDMEEAKKLGVLPIDLVVVNLYPFEKQPLVEQIDIGGVTLLRAAAKNWEWVTVVCDTEDYGRVASAVEKNGDTTVELRKELAAKAFLKTAAYDAAITEWLSGGSNHGLFMTGGKKLRYGENPHQTGKIYSSITYPLSPNPWGVAGAEVLQGKEMSYLNYLDADAAWQCAMEFEDPTAVFLKHASPCGVASNSSVLEAFRRGYDSDPRSAFGVIIALNRTCPADVVEEIVKRKIFVEILAAPDFAAKALQLLTERPNIRVLKVQSGDDNAPEYRSISGGILVQSRDRARVGTRDLKIVTRRKPTKAQISDLLFAWAVCKHVKSNAIVLAKERVTVGIGPGQTSRVDATEIAVRKAGSKAQGAVMASDAFLPFPDALEVAAKAGVPAVIQPGGSVRDAEVIAAADKLSVAMAFTDVRAFKH